MSLNCLRLGYFMYIPCNGQSLRTVGEDIKNHLMESYRNDESEGRIAKNSLCAWISISRSQLTTISTDGEGSALSEKIAVSAPERVISLQLSRVQTKATPLVQIQVQLQSASLQLDFLYNRCSLRGLGNNHCDQGRGG